ncbi:proteome of centriole 5-like isoform 1 [Anopheles sinensis]|uniref:Proteome of centriole 5-like isoform 1 n=1 Tax=Anopheles sinensis TaxID=74873 RepID=A0A084WT47_ANOSI|nr:proteome of centriole 5-like isoform 1 [Anopheles sinensis]
MWPTPCGGANPAIRLLPQSSARGEVFIHRGLSFLSAYVSSPVIRQTNRGYRMSRAAEATLSGGWSSGSVLNFSPRNCSHPVSSFASSNLECNRIVRKSLYYQQSDEAECNLCNRDDNFVLTSHVHVGALWSAGTT